MSQRLAAPERRKELLRAAVVVFARSNYRAARVGDIAAEAGISEPLLYRHFPSKKALFCELLDRTGRRIVDIWHDEIDGAPDAVEALRRTGRVYVRNLVEHPEEARLQFQALAESADAEIAAVLRTNHERYVAFFTSLIERGVAEGVVRADVDVRTVGWILDGIGVAFTVRDLLDTGSAQVGATDERTIEQVIAWLAVEPPTGRPRREEPQA